MKNIFLNSVIALLVVGNLITCFMIIDCRRPRCISDECSRARVSGSHYCKMHDGHIDHELKGEICLEVITKN